MFSNNNSDKVTYFGVWSDSARDRSYRREALRICAEAVERCIDLDLRDCPNVQAALAYLEDNSERTGGVRRFRRALDMQAPLVRAAEIEAACIDIGRASFISRKADL
jgi:hypothetical protein